MKTCAQCQGKLGLGVRARNVWNGRWWVHLRFCSAQCEALYQLERRDAMNETRAPRDKATAASAAAPVARWRSHY
jgi:hypothetical protein